MTLEEAEHELPNGFHDAEIERMTYDLLNKNLSFEVFVWIGTMDDPPSTRERYKRGTIYFEQVQYFSQGVPRDTQDDLKILGFDQQSSLPPEVLKSLSSRVSSYRFYTGYIELEVACAKTRFEWSGQDEINRDPE